MKNTGLITIRQNGNAIQILASVSCRSTSILLCIIIITNYSNLSGSKIEDLLEVLIKYYLYIMETWQSADEDKSYYTSPYDIVNCLWDINYNVPAEFYLIQQRCIYDQCIANNILNDAGRYILDLAMKRRHGISFNTIIDNSDDNKFPVELGDLDERSIKGILKYLVMVYSTDE
jgi:hypothetical protein